jgi:DNA polymerase elongation subunit (family B)
MALTKITKEFAGHWIYADTDAIYFYNFKEIESRFKEFIRTNRLTANYNFDYETDKSGMFIGRKKYIIKDIKTGAITLKGIRLK